MTDQTAKKRENKVLRHNEYYAIQDVFDGLYAKSKQGAIFNVAYNKSAEYSTCVQAN